MSDSHDNDVFNKIVAGALESLHYNGLSMTCSLESKDCKHLETVFADLFERYKMQAQKIRALAADNNTLKQEMLTMRTT